MTVIGGIGAVAETRLNGVNSRHSPLAQRLSTQTGPGSKRVPALSHFAKLGNQLVAFHERCVLLGAKSIDGPRKVVQSSEVVDAGSPLGLQAQHRVAGVPFLGLPQAVLRVPFCGVIMCLALCA